ncbi:GNAT family N-acetyltransferase [Streptomyces bambusae]|uniref:GNAT family N-acetyltransferase n=1 Tax=Streptomyces bambusae TaxID=1550616 RepID=UPI001CFE4340|nr:GNAT family N-acetyltransferase [Streptomyces bambusae]MCB5166517.1 GNAT family N-acetyltransferase [Streptomyces bambusae]
MSLILPPIVPPGRMSEREQPTFRLAHGMELRPWEAGDAGVLARSCLDPDIRHWNRPEQLTVAGAREKIATWRRRWQSEAAAIWAIAPEGAEALGLIGVADLDLPGGQGEILYWLLPAGRGRGLMTEATLRISHWALHDLGLHRLRLTHSVHNPSSCRTATRAGFPLEGTMRQALLHSDGWHDEHLHARLHSDPPPS